VSVPRNYLDRSVPVIGAGTLARRIAFLFATRGGLVRIHARSADWGTRRWTRSSNNATNCRKPIPDGYEAAQNLPRIGRRRRRCLAGGRINSESAKAGIDSESR
jgi:3-hydroxyacyl-CoA dehydrogenase